MSDSFQVQLTVDLLSVGFVDKIGYRASMVAAHLFAAGGLGLLALLPDLLEDPFMGLLAGVVLYAVGGGLLEVLHNILPRPRRIFLHIYPLSLPQQPTGGYHNLFLFSSRAPVRTDPWDSFRSLAV